MYNKRVVKKSEPTQPNHFKLPLKTLEIGIFFRGPKIKNFPGEHAPGPP